MGKGWPHCIFLHITCFSEPELSDYRRKRRPCLRLMTYWSAYFKREFIHIKCRKNWTRSHLQGSQTRKFNLQKSINCRFGFFRIGFGAFKGIHTANSILSPELRAALGFLKILANLILHFKHFCLFENEWNYFLYITKRPEVAFHQRRQFFIIVQSRGFPETDIRPNGTRLPLSACCDLFSVAGCWNYWEYNARWTWWFAALFFNLYWIGTSTHWKVVWTWSTIYFFSPSKRDNWALAAVIL